MLQMLDTRVPQKHVQGAATTAESSSAVSGLRFKNYNELMSNAEFIAAARVLREAQLNLEKQTLLEAQSGHAELIASGTAPVSGRTIKSKAVIVGSALAKVEEKLGQLDQPGTYSREILDQIISAKNGSTGPQLLQAIAQSGVADAYQTLNRLYDQTEVSWGQGIWNGVTSALSDPVTYVGGFIAGSGTKALKPVVAPAVTAVVGSGTTGSAIATTATAASVATAGVGGTRSTIVNGTAVAADNSDAVIALGNITRDTAISAGAGFVGGGIASGIAHVVRGTATPVAQGVSVTRPPAPPTAASPGSAAVSPPAMAGAGRGPGGAGAHSQRVAMRGGDDAAMTGLDMAGGGRHMVRGNVAMRGGGATPPRPGHSGPSMSGYHVRRSATPAPAPPVPPSSASGVFNVAQNSGLRKMGRIYNPIPTAYGQVKRLFGRGRFYAKETELAGAAKRIATKMYDDILAANTHITSAGRELNVTVPNIVESVKAIVTKVGIPSRIQWRYDPSTGHVSVAAAPGARIMPVKVIPERTPTGRVARTVAGHVVAAGAVVGGLGYAGGDPDDSFVERTARGSAKVVSTVGSLLGTALDAIGLHPGSWWKTGADIAIGKGAGDKIEKGVGLIRDVADSTVTSIGGALGSAPPRELTATEKAAAAAQQQLVESVLVSRIRHVIENDLATREFGSAGALGDALYNAFRPTSASGGGNIPIIIPGGATAPSSQANSNLAAFNSVPVSVQIGGRTITVKVSGQFDFQTEYNNGTGPAVNNAIIINPRIDFDPSISLSAAERAELDSIRSAMAQGYGKMKVPVYPESQAWGASIRSHLPGSIPIPLTGWAIPLPNLVGQDAWQTRRFDPQWKRLRSGQQTSSTPAVGQAQQVAQVAPLAEHPAVQAAQPTNGGTLSAAASANSGGTRVTLHGSTTSVPVGPQAVALQTFRAKPDLPDVKPAGVGLANHKIG